MIKTSDRDSWPPHHLKHRQHRVRLSVTGLTLKKCTEFFFCQDAFSGARRPLYLGQRGSLGGWWTTWKPSQRTKVSCWLAAATAARCCLLRPSTCTCEKITKINYINIDRLFLKDKTMTPNRKAQTVGLKNRSIQRMGRIIWKHLVMSYLNNTQPNAQRLSFTLVKVSHWEEHRYRIPCRCWFLCCVVLSAHPRAPVRSCWKVDIILWIKIDI